MGGFGLGSDLSYVLGLFKELGSDDSVIPAAHAEVARRALPGSRLEIFEGSGHFPHHDDPVRFLKALREFLREAPPNEHSQARWRQLLNDGGPAAAEQPDNGERDAVSSGS